MTDPTDGPGAKRARDAKRLFDGTAGLLITLVAVEFLMLLKLEPSAMHLVPLALALPLAYLALRAWKASAPLREAVQAGEEGGDDIEQERANLAIATLSAGMARSGGAVGITNAARASRANDGGPGPGQP